MNLTPEQEQAVNERGRDVVVTAGAGSGKTRVLVERYISLLQNHDIDQLVAVTFTDAAATEMRGRVRQSVTNQPDLRRHVASLDHAIIGTIHSFCLQLLQENPVEAGIDPGATVLDENVSQIEILSACRDAIEAAASEEGPGLQALLALGIRQAQQALPRMVARRDEIPRSYAALGGTSPAEWERHIRRTLDDFLTPLIDECRKTLNECRVFLEGAQQPRQSDKLTPYVREALEVLGNPMDCERDEFISRLLTLALLNSPGGVGSQKAWFYTPKEIRDALKEMRSAYGALSAFFWNDADVNALVSLESLRHLFQDASKRYAARKNELAAVDFLDLELKTIKMLRDFPAVAAACRTRFRHILVDEAQDLNPTQYELLALLTFPGDGEPRPERFFVGDAKQSIYRFRRSDVRYLNRLRAEIEATQGATISLNTSFRSHEILVETLNSVMDSVLGSAEEEYEAGMEPMKWQRPSNSALPPVEVLQVARAHANPEIERQPTARELRRKEASMVANSIRRVVRGEYEIWDKEQSKYRQAQPGDVVILLRNMLHVNEYERALENLGIPYRTASTGDFYTRPEIIDLTNLLEWLSEPANDIALVGLLRSPFFAIDDESLIALSRARGTWLDALRDPPPGVHQETRPLCLHASRVLGRLRDESRLATPDQLLESALMLTNYEASWAPLRGGDQALVNIRRFVGMARELADAAIDGFVGYIRLLRDDLGTRAPQAALDASDAVRLLTIHSAKGLEFPVVVLAEAGAARGNSRAPTVLWRADEGISMTLEQDSDSMEESRPKPAFYHYLAEQEKREDEAESKRLLYVAATRAADLLIITGVESAGDTPTWADNFIDSNAANAGILHWTEKFDLYPAALGGADEDDDSADGDDDLIGDPVRSDASDENDESGIEPDDEDDDADGSEEGYAAAPVFHIPPAEEEQPAHAPLIGRRGAIPIRSSTPATALERHDTGTFSGRPDPLALVRGTLAHMAIEEWFKTGARPDLREIALRLDARLGSDAVTDIAMDVDAMLNDFDASSLAASLRHPAVKTYFELPFSWDWDGIAVHGSIDLAFENEGEWHVVDFKTDRVEKGREGERASAYLTQLGVYAGAIEAATGRRPKTGLMFLRTGTLHWVGETDIQAALNATRDRIDDGAVSVGEIDGVGEFADERLG